MIAVNSSAYPVSGTSALQPQAMPALKVIEGGRRYAHAPKAQPSVRHGHALASRRHIARALVVTALCAVALALGVAGIHSARENAVSDAIAAQSQTVEVVRDGEGLLDLARAHRVEGVTDEELASWIKRQNGLRTSELQPGQRLVVPGQHVTRSAV